MKRLFVLNLLFAVSLFSGCSWLGELIVSNLNQPRPPERAPGWSDERHEFAKAEHDLNIRMREMREAENESCMEQYGYPKYRNEYWRPANENDEEPPIRLFE